MASQYDFEPGLNISALSSATAAQLMQLISQAAPLSNIGGIIFQSTTPDVASNPRFARYIWLDSTTDPAVAKYYNAGTTSWTAVSVAAGSITNSEISASAAIAVTKLAAGTARYILRTNAGGTANEFVAPTGIFNSDELAVVKLTSNGGTDGYLKSVSGVTQWIANATERAAIAASLNSLNPTVLAAGSNNTLLGTNSSGVVGFAAIGSLLANNAIGLNLLAAGGAAANDILMFDGTNWVKVTPGISLSSAAINIGVMSANGINTTVHTFAHGLGTIPKNVYAVLVNTSSAEAGYATNDEVAIHSFRDTGDGNPVIAVSADATNITVCCVSAASLEVPHKSTAAQTSITESQWKPKVYAWK